MIKDDQREWFRNLPKNKFRIMVRILKSDSLKNCDTFEEVAITYSIWDSSKISMVVDASLVISVDRYVTDGMF